MTRSLKTKMIHIRDDAQPELHRRKSDFPITEPQADIVKIESQGAITRLFHAARGWIGRDYAPHAIDRIERRVQAVVNREALVMDKLLLTVAKDQPTSLTDTIVLYFKALQDVTHLTVHLKRGDGSYRGYMQITRSDPRQEPVVGRLSSDLDTGEGLVRLALAQDRIVLQNDDTLYSISRFDTYGRVERERMPYGGTGLDELVIPYNRGIVVASGPRVRVPRGLTLQPEHSTVRLAREVSHILTMDAKAKIDPLTGLITRDQYRKTLLFLAEQYVERQADACRRNENTGICSVIATDVDMFKKYNDEHGHATGDRVLQMVASQAQGTMRVSDIVSKGAVNPSSGSRDIIAAGQNAFRIGGEEMIIIAADTDSYGGAIAAERFRMAVQTGKTYDNNGKPVPQVTASAGVADFFQAQWALETEYIHAKGKDRRLEDKKYSDMTNGEKAEAIAEVTPILADRALYAAKNCGRNRVYYVAIVDVSGIQDLKYLHYVGRST